MLAYTITNGGTYSADAYEYRYTTSITDTIGGQADDDCNQWPATISRTFCTKLTERSFHDGRASTYIFISYKDNNRTAYQVKDAEDACIGGYYSTNSFTLRGSTVVTPNGKATFYNESLGVKTSAGGLGVQYLNTFPIITREVLNQPWFDTFGLPTTTTQTVVRRRYNTTITKASFKSSFIKVGDTITLVNFETNQKVSTTPIDGKTTVETVITNDKKRRRIGYSNEKGLFGNALGLNYVDTVVFITNNNILWYITDLKEGQFSEKFKPTRGIGKQITIKHTKPTKKERLPIGSYVYGESPPAVKSTASTQTTALSVISFKEQNVTFNGYATSFPIGTTVSKAEILLNSSEKFTIKTYIKYDKTVSTELTTNYKTILQLINGNSLQFHRTYREKARKKELSTIKTFVASTFGEYVQTNPDGGRTTFKDNKGYTSLVPNRYSLNVDGGGELLFNKAYFGGQAAINNLSIVEQVSFKDGKTYKNINGQSSSLYPNVPLAFATFAKSFTFNFDNSTKTATAYSPIQDTNLKLDLRYVLISSSKTSISNNGQKYTKIETTKHEFGLKGAKPNTYLNFTSQNINPGLIGIPQGIFTLPVDVNCGIFCDDGQTENSITRILYPGTYLVINIDKSLTSVIKQPITTNQNNKSYYYLPWNGSIESAGSLNFISPSVIFASYNISHFLPDLGSMTNI